MKTPVIILAAFVPLLAQDNSPIVRASFSPHGSVLVGQPVRLTISVLVPTFFSGEPDFPELSIQGTIVSATEDRPTNFNEPVNGSTYFGISKDYLIYPQSPGDFALPPEPITVKYSAGGIKTAEAHLKLPTAKFTATIPTEAEGLGYFIATTSLTATQHLDKKLTDLKVGDSFHRTITVHVANTFSMFLPPLEFEAPEGIRIYPGQPKVDDLRTDRGDFTGGRRIDSATYLIQKEGHYQLPEILISWWDLNAKRMRTTRIRAIEFDAIPNPAYKPELTPYVQPVMPAQPVEVSPWDRVKGWLKPTAIALTAIAVFWLAWRRYSPRVRDAIKHRRWEKEHSQAAQLERVIAAAKRNDAPTTMGELLHLDDRLRNAPQASLNLPQLRSSIDDLERVLYSIGSAEPWVGKPLVDALHTASRGYRVAVRHHERGAILPPLNP